MLHSDHTFGSVDNDIPQSSVLSRALRAGIALALSLAVAAATTPWSGVSAQSVGCGAGVTEETIMVYSNPPSGTGYYWFYPPRSFPTTAMGLRDAVNYAATLPYDEVVRIPSGGYGMGSSPLVIPPGASTLTLIGNGGQLGQNMNGGPTTINSTGNFAIVGANLSDVTIQDIEFIAYSGPGAVKITSSAEVALTCLNVDSGGIAVNLDGAQNRLEDSKLRGITQSSTIALRLAGSSSFIANNDIRIAYNVGTGVYMASGAHILINNVIEDGVTCVLSNSTSSGPHGIADNEMFNCHNGVDLQGSFHTITRNQIYPYQGTGIRVAFGSDNSIVDNGVTGPVEYGVSLFAVHGSDVQRNSMESGMYGIFMDGASSNNFVSANSITGFSEHGIYAHNAGGGASNNWITDNQITCTGGGTLAAIKIASGNGNIISTNNIDHWQTSPENEVIVLPVGHSPAPSGNTINPCIPTP